jgi:NitT/TauT family transport system permease protein
MRSSRSTRRRLPLDALRTVLRMLAALAASLVFTFAYGALAAKSRRAGQVLLPILDILQSVPVLGYISFTVAVLHGRCSRAARSAPSCAAIFAIFTSQAWNMAFSFYQSLRTVPRDLDEACRSLQLGGWQRFWRLEVPFAMPGPGLEHDDVDVGRLVLRRRLRGDRGRRPHRRPARDRLLCRGRRSSPRTSPPSPGRCSPWSLVIALYDQLLFRPLVAWADKFRSSRPGRQRGGRRFRAAAPAAAHPAGPRRRGAAARAWLRRLLLLRFLPSVPRRGRPRDARAPDGRSAGWFAAVAVAALAVRRVPRALSRRRPRSRRGVDAVGLGRAHAGARRRAHRARQPGLGAGRHLGSAGARASPRRPAGRAVPRRLPGQSAVPGRGRRHRAYGLDADIWLSPLMILGAQWYILFNVIAGARAYPADLSEVADSLRLGGWRRWRRALLPGIFPYYVTGAVTASGGAWNASIVAEAGELGQHHARRRTASAPTSPTPRSPATIRASCSASAVMALYVTLFNRLLWRRLYVFAERRLRID